MSLFEQIEVLFEDEDIVVVNKPEGLVVTPGAYYSEVETLVGWLMDRYGEGLRNVGNEAHRPGIVHRLDKDTSGVMVAAKNQQAFEYLIKQFKSRNVEKVYKTIVWGDVRERTKSSSFVINAPIARNPRNRMRFAVVADGKESLTKFGIDMKFSLGKDVFTLLSCYPKTGRTHQIRVHLKSFGYSVLGDPLYQRKSEKEHLFDLIDKGDVAPRMFLHAYTLCIKPLSTRELTVFTAALPVEFSNLLSKGSNV